MKRSGIRMGMAKRSRKYTATAVHEDEAKRNPNGAWRREAGSIRRQPTMRMKRSGIRMGMAKESGAWRKLHEVCAFGFGEEER